MGVCVCMGQPSQLAPSNEPNVFFLMQLIKRKVHCLENIVVVDAFLSQRVALSSQLNDSYYWPYSDTISSEL